MKKEKSKVRTKAGRQAEIVLHHMQTAFGASACLIEMMPKKDKAEIFRLIESGVINYLNQLGKIAVQ